VAESILSRDQKFNVPELTQGPSKTPRDYFTDMLRKFGAGKHTARSYGDRLFGNDDKMGFLDVTPLGIPEAARRTGRSIGNRDLYGAITNSLGMIPGGMLGGAVKAAKKPVGSVVTRMLDKGPHGQSPKYGVIDESDNSLAMEFGGFVRPRSAGGPTDYHVGVSTAIPDPSEVRALGQQINPKTGRPFLNQQQVNDTMKMRLRSDPDALALQGLIPGNAVRSGIVTGSNTRRHVLDALGAATLTKPLRKAEGVITGHRQTGAKPIGKTGPPAAISMEMARSRAKKHGIRPAQDISLPRTEIHEPSPLKTAIAERNRRFANRPPRGAQDDGPPMGDIYHEDMADHAADLQSLPLGERAVGEARFLVSRALRSTPDIRRRAERLGDLRRRGRITNEDVDTWVTNNAIELDDDLLNLIADTLE
jgi:hypothetical protein